MSLWSRLFGKGKPEVPEAPSGQRPQTAAAPPAASPPPAPPAASSPPPPRAAEQAATAGERTPAQQSPPAAGARRPLEPSPRPPGPAAPPAAAWAARPVFVSSTFRDLQAERSYLRDHVFPRLEEALRQRHLYLEPIDLRLGVETTQARTEAERELLVLKVCLDQIKRSRPFLLVLLGERYGWIPPEERLAAAAREQSFATSVAGKSVTALEIEYGLFKEDPAQRQRSLFFLRAPLDLDAIPASLRADYSDADAADPVVRAGYARLQALTERLRSDPEYAPRVFEYPATWDPAANAVAGLEAFGELVHDELWALLEEETRDREAAAPATWQQQEQQELLEFVEHRSRLVLGRAALLAELQALLDDPRPEAPWAACVTGAPGLGKSAVFAALVRARTAGAEIVLASAAGGMQRGGSVDAMLRRFIAELDQALGFRTEIPDAANAAQIEELFHAGLHRASAAGRRVVLLLDALDQFETTVRGQQLTWLRRSAWPLGVRLVATAQPGVVAQALQALAGVRAVALPPLTLADAQELGPQVWQHYHPQLNPGLLAVLTDKRQPDGTLACGNPLWLILALEQLTLLDAEDFARAEREFAGSPDQRRLALLLDTAQRLPPDIAGLYEWLLAHTERAHGVALTQGFALAIALSRQGWREADLLDLTPRLARLLAPGEPIPDLNELRLATLRRAFRAHALRRGPLQQVDFFHAQMRQAVLQRYVPQRDQRRPLHAAISDYLETLPGADPLVELERMRQLIAEHDALRAARYYAAVDPAAHDAAARSGATWTLVEWLSTAGTAQETEARLGWVGGWLDDAGLTAGEIGLLAQNFLFGVADTLAPLAPLALRVPVVQASRAALERLTARDSGNTRWQHGLAASHHRIGDVLVAQGDGAGALAAYRQGLAIRELLAARDPANTDWQRDLSLSHERIGTVLLAQGNGAGALAAYRQSLALIEALVARDPANTAWQRDLSVNQIEIGDVLRAQGDGAGAEAAYRKCQATAEALAARDPANTGWQRNLSVSHNRIGAVLVAQGDGAGALQAYRKSHAIAEALAARDPANTDWQLDLAVSHDSIGNVLVAQGDGAGAEAAYRKYQAIAEALTARDPANTDWQRDLAVYHQRIGDVLQAQGNGAGALVAFRKFQATAEALVARDPANTLWQTYLTVSCAKLGTLEHGQTVDARRGHLLRGKAILHELKAAGRLMPNQDWRAWFEQQLNRLSREAVYRYAAAGVDRAILVSEEPPSPERKRAARVDRALLASDRSVHRRTTEVPASRIDKVHFSVASPPSAELGRTFIVYVWAHLDRQRAEVERRIRHAYSQSDAPPLIRPKGPFKIERGTTLFVRLRFPDLCVDSPEDVILWEGEVGDASFEVAVPPETAEGVKSGLVTVHWEGGLQIARVPLQILVARKAVPAPPTTQPLHHIRKAFACYASPDRDEVLGRVQGMQKIAPDLDVFLDVAKLRSGEDWERKLWQVISESDVLYLFWSAAAKASPWVEKEWRCALNNRGEEFIDPVPLISPDEVRPPDELCKKHFDDWVLAYRRGTLKPESG